MTEPRPSPIETMMGKHAFSVDQEVVYKGKRHKIDRFMPYGQYLIKDLAGNFKTSAVLESELRLPLDSDPPGETEKTRLQKFLDKIGQSLI